jgi:hypothetical protein
MTVSSRVDWCPAVVVGLCLCGISTLFHQELDHLEVAIAGSRVDWCPSITVRYVNPSTTVQQQLNQP